MNDVLFHQEAHQVRFSLFFVIGRYIDFRKREGGKREREIVQLPPIRALTRNQTHNLLVYRMMLYPTEPPGQASLFFDVSCCQSLYEFLVSCKMVIL